MPAMIFRAVETFSASVDEPALETFKTARWSVEMPSVFMQQAVKALCQEASAYQQHHCNRKLDHYQAFAHPPSLCLRLYGRLPSNLFAWRKPEL